MNIFRKTLRAFSAVALGAAVVAAGVLPCFADGNTAVPKKEMGSLEAFEYVSNISYSDYKKSDEVLPDAEKGFDFDAFATVTADSGAKVETFADRKGLLAEEGSKVTWKVNVPVSGAYNIEIDYYVVPGVTTNAKFAVGIDGYYPFSEAESVSLKRVWLDSGKIRIDTQGNEIRPSASESAEWQTKYLSDISGFSQEPYRFYLTAGEHELSFEVFKNSFAIGAIRFTSPSAEKTYAEALAEYEKLGYKDASKPLEVIQAEKIRAKSDKSITIMNDRASPMTYPSDSFNVVYNCIGGENWSSAGQWVEWDIDVPEDGLYTVVLRFQQSEKANDVSSRALYIDGEVPFTEAKRIIFNYASGWQVAALGDSDGNPYKFHFTAGKHTIRLEANLGNYSDVLSDVNVALSDLNGIYRDILMITGSSPDTERDYEFDKLIPGTLEEITRMITVLKDLEKRVEIITAGGGQSTAVFKRLYTQLESMADEHKTIAKRFGTFKTNITSLGTWINEARSQPLAIDYIQLSNSSTELPAKEKNFFAVVWYYIKQFFNSFMMDYSTVGNLENDADKEITVWIATGRDQADIIRQMANDTFTPEKGISANIQLVNAGALLPATLAGIGPDVYIGMDETSPVNYALRNAVVDVSKFEGIEEVTSRFYDSALVPFRLDGGLYAIPETMVYPMMFYRKDILTDLGIGEEDLTTWDSLLQKVLPELEMNYFEFGMTTTVKSYAMLLEQYGGKFYNDDNTASALSSQEALKAFQHMTSLYKDYGLPLAFDFSNRFRSGEMPLAITEFSAYNQMSVFAPEIDGLWGMMPVPGIKDENGNVYNATVCTVTGVVILAKSKDIPSAWEFVKWWTQADTQSRYGTDLETVMGTGARYASANVEAMKSVQWDRNVAKSLSVQLENVVGMPQIAGSYFTPRHFDFAFRDVVYNSVNSREALEDASEDITTEIQDKRSEFYDE